MTTGSPEKSTPDATALPSRLPPPTGNLFYDSLTVRMSSDTFEIKILTPCNVEREILLLPALRKGSANGGYRPMVAANWAVGTFVTITLASWHICDRRWRSERERVAQILQHKPRHLKQEQPSEPETAKDS
ncbi:hypothetical protein CVT24_007002 [Panaeolus cyanescens]|uniref:Cytochrome c oxidase assembly protein COX20, mitochondrial n=1 Tax=Panaeolus cyanescens TaxID=181874 RepID=A0A409YLP9_9AGAR|nr:hypothetical protein CVT24_007002 [Panaeolus cyanescens]